MVVWTPWLVEASRQFCGHHQSDGFVLFERDESEIGEDLPSDEDEPHGEFRSSCIKALFGQKNPFW